MGCQSDIQRLRCSKLSVKEFFWLPPSTPPYVFGKSILDKVNFPTSAGNSVIKSYFCNIDTKSGSLIFDPL